MDQAELISLLKNITPTAKISSDEFLAIYKQFQLGGLLTE
jgi:hypothetical protein